MNQVEFIGAKFLNGSAYCPLEDALDVEIIFKALRPLHNAKWQVKVWLDIVGIMNYSNYNIFLVEVHSRCGNEQLSYG